MAAELHGSMVPSARMRRALVAVLLAGCHVISQVDTTRPGRTETVHHLDQGKVTRQAVLVGEAGTLLFVDHLECPTERRSVTMTTTEITAAPNLATFVVGVIATSVGAIALAKGAFDKDGVFLAVGGAGLAVGLPMAVGPWLSNTHELREQPAPNGVVIAEGTPEPCGTRPLVSRSAVIAVHGLQLAGAIDARGAFAVSPFTVVDAYQVTQLPAWDAVITIDGRPGFTQVIAGNELAVHAFEFLQKLDVDTAIQPMRLVPGLVAGPLRVSLTSDASGPLLRIVLSLTNDGPGDASAVRGQIASQSPLVDSRMIYVGAIKKGATVTRELLIPLDAPTAAILRDDPLDLSIELRDGHGTAPANPVKFRGIVLADAPR